MALIGLLAAAGAVAAFPLSPKDPLSWLRASTRAIGCMLERDVGSPVDRPYGCAAKKDPPSGDPCTATTAYYAGPQLSPKADLAKIGPGIAAVALTWEHGALQSLTITTKAKIVEAKARALILKGRDAHHLPDNVQRVSIRDCGRAATCIDAEGFDHMGSGDLECPPEPAPANKKPAP